WLWSIFLRVALLSAGTLAFAFTAFYFFTGGIVHAHGQGDALAGYVYFHHFDFYNVSSLHNFAWIFHKGVGQCGDMNQAILMYADIDKGAEVGDVGDGAFQDHAGVEIIN